MRAREKQKFMADAISALGLSQTTFGAELGLNQSQISHLLTGVRTIKLYHILATEGLLNRNGLWPLK